MSTSPKLVALALLLAACPGRRAASPKSRTYDQLDRAELNRLAVHEDLPLFWIEDADGDRAVDPDEVASLLFYSTTETWAVDGAFTPAFDAAYDRLLAARTAKPADRRLALVIEELDQGRPTLVLTEVTADERPFVDHMRTVAAQIEALFSHLDGSAALADRVADVPSRRLFMRNHGPACLAPATTSNPECTAIAGAPTPKVDLYPPGIDCATLEQHPDADALLAPFTVVRGTGADLHAVPYAEAYADEMGAIADELDAAAGTLDAGAEPALIAYLRAAAQSFRDNDWTPADEAWAAMNAENSKWYVRVGPDEVFWDPCERKGGFHLTFARINQGSLEWQRKLTPLQDRMEESIAARAGKPYRAHPVSFHLPDFIDIVINAGDDRDPLTATVGQSLPNWGPVANEGRGRTVAMTNLYTDRDSLETRRAVAEGLLDAETMRAYVDATQPGLLATILHEATHNLGPSHEYEVDGKVDTKIFGGPQAGMLEELKAQTGALYLVELLRAEGVIDDQLAAQSYVDATVWALGHIARGLYSADGDRNTYSQVGAIQLGYLLDEGALTWSDDAVAANGTDRGAFTIHADKLVPAIDRMMAAFAGIKARGDKAAADALDAVYVDGKKLPLDVIAARFQRFPRASFVYAIRD